MQEFHRRHCPRIIAIIPICFGRTGRARFWARIPKETPAVTRTVMRMSTIPVTACSVEALAGQLFIFGREGHTLMAGVGGGH